MSEKPPAPHEIYPLPPGTVTVQPGPLVGAVPVNGPMINNQPNSKGVWMPVPLRTEGVPQGLEYLAFIDKLVVRQLLEIRELFLNYEAKNKYALLNANGELVYYAFEESSLWQRCFCGPYRRFVVHIADNLGREVLRIQRPFKCCGGGCYGIFAYNDCCRFNCIVEAPPGNVIGTIVQRQACCVSRLNVKDVDGRDVLKIDGPYLTCRCSDVDFPVQTTSGIQIGGITKKWGGCLWESFTDVDTFSVKFPMDLETKTKALLLGATFLIDFMEFESNARVRK